MARRYVDVIEAEAAIKDLFADMPRIEFMGNRRRWREENEQYLRCLDVLRSLQTADVRENIHAHWIPYEFGNERWHKCSACGKADEYINERGIEAVRKFCPNCGAEMEERRMQETAISSIPKERAAFVKDDEKFIEFITDELTKEISERLIRALEESYEIVVKKPVLKVSEYPPTGYVEYRKTVDWEPLVRCKDCKYNSLRMGGGNSFCELGTGLSQIYDFCSLGERRE